MKIKPIKKIYDAHLHFPIKLKEPYAALREEVMAVGLRGGLMIINSDVEASVFWANFDSIMNGDLGFTPQVAFVLNVHSKMWHENFDRMHKRGFSYIVKLHPRISNITRRDFDAVRDTLMTMDAEAIVVDNWVFGPQIENHIGTELTIYLSQNLPDKRIIMAHAGGVRILETMLLTRPLENVYFDLAATCCYFKKTSVQRDIIHFLKYTKERVMFGSDYPEFPVQKAIKAIKNGLEKAELTEEEQSKIMYKTAKIILGGVISLNFLSCCFFIWKGTYLKQAVNSVSNMAEKGWDNFAL